MSPKLPGASPKGASPLTSLVGERARGRVRRVPAKVARSPTREEWARAFGACARKIVSNHVRQPLIEEFSI